MQHLTARPATTAYYRLTHPVRADEQRAQATLIEAFGGKMLRLEWRINSTWCPTTEAVIPGGQALLTGSPVRCSNAAANPVGLRYSNPDALDRSCRSGHFPFGGGIHTYPGARLVRLKRHSPMKWLRHEDARRQPLDPATHPQHHPSSHFRALFNFLVTSQPPASPHV
jgi:cytochrome P450